MPALMMLEVSVRARGVLCVAMGCRVDDGRARWEARREADDSGDQEGECCLRRATACVHPIASVIVDRASKKARTPQELYQILAAEISSPADRAAFLKLTPWAR